MLLMALDHTRDYFSQATFSPLNLTRTTAGLFFTRWITHFCAPVFIFLAGVGAFLWAASRGKSKVELAQFLLTRGLGLIGLELTLVHLAWFFSLTYDISLAQVIWAIGWAMIALAGMVFLPNVMILILAVVLIAGHNLLDGLSPYYFNGFDWLWIALHTGGMLEPLPGHQFFVLYPLLPWIGVMALGYGLGPLFQFEPSKRRTWLLGLGLGCSVAFVGLRALNSYGDPRPWSEQKDALFTFLSFINLEKYPPSLLYLLMTLGPAWVVLAVIDQWASPLTRPLAILGRVPLFFYVVHLFLIHALAVVFAYAHYGQADWLFGAAWFFREGYPRDYGYDLFGVYAIWLVVILTLYLVCHWFVNFKQRRQEGWLSYF